MLFQSAHNFLWHLALSTQLSSISNSSRPAQVCFDFSLSSDIPKGTSTICFLTVPMTTYSCHRYKTNMVIWANIYKYIVLRFTCWNAAVVDKSSTPALIQLPLITGYKKFINIISKQLSLLCANFIKDKGYHCIVYFRSFLPTL